MKSVEKQELHNSILASCRVKQVWYRNGEQEEEAKEEQ